MDGLLVKYLLDEATAAERQQAEVWINETEEHKKYFEHFRLIWEQSKKLAATANTDTDAAWQRFKQRVDITPANKTISFPKQVYSWARIAAVLLVMVGLGGYFYYNNVLNGMTTIASGNNVLSQTLPDGSIITLNKNSSISYPKQFRGNTRDVALVGEAFFDVAPNKAKPFIIHVDEVNVKVVGTSFNINSNKLKTEVVVETGIVEVSKNAQVVKLKPKEKATVTKANGQVVKAQSTDELYNYYRTREFICNGTPLWRLADVLNEAYNVNIVVDDRVKNLPLNTTFHNESLDNILEVVSGTFNVKVEKKEGQIYIK